MATATKTSSSARPPAKNAGKKAAKPMDAIALLRADHKAVAALFAEFASTKAPGKKKALVAKICSALGVHAQVEEEIFYPAVKQALKDKVLIPEAIIEQQTMKALIGQVQGAEPDGEMYDARVTVLAEYVKHHVKEEHTEMFPKAKASKLDMLALGAVMAERKAQLLALQG